MSDGTRTSVGTVNSLTLVDGSVGQAGNYSLGTGQTASASITPKALSATASAQDKTYDGTVTAVGTTLSLSGLVGSEAITATVDGSTFNEADVADATTVILTFSQPTGASMSHVHVIAVITAEPGLRGQLLEKFQANVPAVLAEDGCLEFGPDHGLPATH
ncbi:MAG: YDG domain-containing protein [Rhodobacterales bacterium]